MPDKGFVRNLNGMDGSGSRGLTISPHTSSTVREFDSNSRGFLRVRMGETTSRTQSGRVYGLNEGPVSVSVFHGHGVCARARARARVCVSERERESV